MNLYLLSQHSNSGYYTHDSCIVAAENEDSARHINPSTGGWNYRWSSWCKTPEDVTVELLGKAVDGTESGIVLSSFNAG